MRWWLRAPYAALGRTAEIASDAAPAASTRKMVRALALRRGATARLARWGETQRDPARPLLWLHAASVGEGLMALPVARRVRELRPDLQLIYTYYSPSAEPFAAALGADVADVLPFDTAGAATRLLGALRPTALVFVRGDVWPVLAESAAHAGIPVGLVNAAFSARSSRGGGIGRALLADAYAALARVGVVSEADAARYVAVGARRDRVRVTGDARYDQAWERAREAPRHAALVQRLTTTDRPTLVAGSTWPADEAPLLAAWRAVRDARPDARLILAPHELSPAHVARLLHWGSDAGLRTASLADATAAHDLIVVDRMGVLAELYAAGDVAYVGGGFHAAGLHSVVEPAVLERPVVIGPRHHEGRDASMLLTAGAALAADSPDTLARAVLDILNDTDRRARMADAARRIVAAELGAADRSAGLVAELLGTV